MTVAPGRSQRWTYESGPKRRPTTQSNQQAVRDTDTIIGSRYVADPGDLLAVVLFTWHGEAEG